MNEDQQPEIPRQVISLDYRAASYRRPEHWLDRMHLWGSGGALVLVGGCGILMGRFCGSYEQFALTIGGFLLIFPGVIMLGYWWYKRGR